MQDAALTYIRNAKVVVKDSGPSNVSWETEKPIITEQMSYDHEALHNQLLENVKLTTSKIPIKLTKEIIENGFRNKYLQSVNTYTKKTVSISNLVGCIKQVYFLFKGEQQYFRPDMYPYSICATSVGNTIHELIQTCGIPYKQVESSLRLDLHGFTVTGRCDIIVNDMVIAELKSIGDLPAKPKPEHMKQVLIYTHLMNTYLNATFKLAQLVYYSRGKSDIKIFDVEYTDKIDKSVKSFLEGFLTSFDDYLKTGNVPEKYVITTNCAFCGFYHKCYNTLK